MISYRDIGNYYEITFLGNTLSDFNSFHKNIRDIRCGMIPRENTIAYKIKKTDIEKLLNYYSNALEIKNEYDEIGTTMKLSPYLYQKEAIHFALKKQNALIILPCGSGNLYYIS